MYVVPFTEEKEQVPTPKSLQSKIPQREITEGKEGRTGKVKERTYY